VSRYYMPSGNLITYRKGIWRQYLLHSVIEGFNRRGADLYKNDRTAREAAARFRIHRAELKTLCAQLQYLPRIEWIDLQHVIEAAGGMTREYERFDTWYTDGAYPLRSDPAVAAALDYAEKEKNVLREEYRESILTPGQEFQEILERVAEQCAIKKEDIVWYFIDDLKRIFEGALLATVQIVARKQAYIYLCDEHGVSTMLFGEDAESYIDAFETGSIPKNSARELRGVCAHKGSGAVRGIARIINSDYLDFSNTQSKMDAMNEGDILIAPTTAPDLMPALRKAAAIVTDVGGMLSHAALTARELNKPCIVGTKVASRVFKDGDMVEVDADKGVVRKV